MNNIKYVWSMFLKRFFNIKLFILLFLFYFVLNQTLLPIKEITDKYNTKVSFWILPFLFTGVGTLFIFIGLAVYYYSNVPFMDYSEMYTTIRVGRRKWILGNIIAIIISGFTIMACIILMNTLILINRINFCNEWGKVVQTIAQTNISSLLNIEFNINYNIIVNYKPLELMIQYYVIGSLIISFIGLIMFTISLYINRIFAVVIGMAIDILFVVEINIGFIFKWIKWISPVTWLDVNQLRISGVNLNPQFQYKLFFLVIGICVLSALLIVKVKKIDFVWYKEE